jgi:hypothetical protein
MPQTANAPSKPIDKDKLRLELLRLIVKNEAKRRVPSR